MDGQRQVGKYIIGNLCYQTHPCQHWVKINDDDNNWWGNWWGNTKTTTDSKFKNEWRMMFGDEIYLMLKKDGKSDKHFNQYKEHIRRRENPTPEEILERQKRMEEVLMEQAAREQKNREDQIIVDKYKASTRIEKLKSKNNIRPGS